MISLGSGASITSLSMSKMFKDSCNESRLKVSSFYTVINALIGVTKSLLFTASMLLRLILASIRPS